MDFEQFDQEYESLLQQAWALYTHGIKNDEQAEQMQMIKQKILTMQHDASEEIRFVTCMMFTEIEMQTLECQSKIRQKIRYQAKDLLGPQYEIRTRIVAGTELWTQKMLQEQDEAELLALSRHYLEGNADDGIGRSFAERNICQLSDDAIEIIEIFHANKDAGLGYQIGLAYMAASKLPASGVEPIAEHILKHNNEIRRIADPTVPAILYGRCIRRLCNGITDNVDELMNNQNLLLKKIELIERLKQAMEELPDALPHKAMAHFIIASMMWVIDETDVALETMCLGLEEAEKATMNEAESSDWETLKKKFHETLEQWRQELESE